MEERLEEEKRKNPASKKVSLIADEIRNTKRIWESIFERREKKIVLAALATVRGGKSMPENLTRENQPVVKILENLPSFVGSDMKKYFLKKEDVISLPPEIADVLIKRKAAVEIKANF